MKKAEDDLEEDTPVIFDDITPGKAMHQSADETMFLKSLFTVTEAAQLHARYTDVHLQRGARIFTTNELDVDAFLELRTAAALTWGHKEAVLRRCVFIDIAECLYDVSQRAQVAEERQAAVVGALATVDALRASGAW